MIDIHCHILPGIDDGAKDLEEALIMARQASEDGITDIICTPHMQNSLYQIDTEHVLASTWKFQNLLIDQNIPLQVLPGAEVHIHPMLLENLEQKKLLTLCHLNKYVLVELPAISIPDYTKFIISELVLEGIIPIIAHPERNSFIRDNSYVLLELIKLGALTQINAGSLLGQMGLKIQKFTEELLKNRMVHLLASDGHNAKARQPILSEAYLQISKKGSVADVELLKENAQAILTGEACKVRSPLYRKRHWIFRWLT